MDGTTRPTPRPATPSDFWRLAALAEARGIKIMVEPLSGDHFATSASDPYRLYRLTHHSCSCHGFMAWQRCTHHSLLLAQLGWLPDAGDDEPEPDPSPAAPALPAPVSVRCAECDGAGAARIQTATGRWCTVHCLACRGSSRVGRGEPAGAETGAEHGSAEPRPAARRTPVNGTDAELAAAKGQALRNHVERGEPLGDPETGEILAA